MEVFSFIENVNLKTKHKTDSSSQRDKTVSVMFKLCLGSNVICCHNCLCPFLSFEI